MTKHVPFININDVDRVKSAQTMLKYPHNYFTDEDNISRLKTILAEEPSAIELANIIRNAQGILSESMQRYKINGDGDFNIKIESVIHNNTDELVTVTSAISNEINFSTAQGLHSKLINTLNINLAEILNGVQITAPNKELGDKKISHLLEISWIVKHFALMLLGALELKIGDNKEFVFTPKDPELLRATWFANALENSSNISDNISIKLFSDFLKNGDGNRETYNRLVSSVYSIVPKNWRLGLEGIFSDNFNEISDLMIIFMTAYQRMDNNPPSNIIFRKDIEDIKSRLTSNSDVVSIFDSIVEFQKTQKVEDRLFDIVHGGLTLGPLSHTIGLIQQVENLIERKVGTSWHDNLENQQKAHIFDYLSKSKHIEILDFELNAHHCDSSKDEDFKLDVDFFIRDLLNNQIYAVQLKHVTSIKESGISAWLKLIGSPKSKLGKGVLQLEKLKSVLESDKKCQKHLINNGIKELEFQNIIPVLLHNIGYLDCFPIHSGIWLYDQITFRKALTGRSGVKNTFENGFFLSEATLGAPDEVIKIDNPQQLIDSYLNDPEYKDFKYFDIAKSLTRSVVLNNNLIQAKAVGI